MRGLFECKTAACLVLVLTISVACDDDEQTEADMVNMAGDTAGEAAGSASGEVAGDTAGEAAGSASGEVAGDTAGETAGSASGEVAGDTAGEDVMTEATKLMGVIVTPEGVGAEGIKVSVGEQETLSSADGSYELTLSAGRARVLFEGQGYLPMRRQSLISSGYQTTLNVTIYPERPPVTLNIDQGGVVETERGARIEIGGGSLVNQQGERVSGDVHVHLTPINPMDRDQAVIVSDSYLARRSDGSFAILESFGMIDITIRDLAGNELQVAPESTLRLTIPVPDYRPCLDTVGFWSFDDEMSLIWREEGGAQCLEVEGQCTCTGEISHMSYWNLDEPNSPTCIKGQLLDADQNPRAGVSVSAWGTRLSSSRTTTDPDGYFVLVAGINEIVSILVEGVLYRDDIDTTGANVIDVVGFTEDMELSPEQIAQCLEIDTLSSDEEITEQISCETFCDLAESCMRPMMIPYNACLTLCMSGLPFPECILGQPSCERINTCLTGRQNNTDTLCTQTCDSLVDCGAITSGESAMCIDLCEMSDPNQCLAQSMMCQDTYECLFSPQEDCDNGIDDDLDNLSDCDDDDCAQAPSCSGICSVNDTICDGIDSDCDGMIDEGADPNTCSNGINVICGDGALQGDEECDDGGESATCDVDCTSAVCGDGVTNNTAGEECDGGPGCSLACTRE